MWWLYAVIAAVVLLAGFYVCMHWSFPWLKKKCTASTTGKYVFYEKDARVQVERHLGAGVATSLITPVYEYNVDGQPYFAEIEGMAQTNDRFQEEVIVNYNPKNPKLCFVDGKRGVIRSKNGPHRKKAEVQ
ncbi:MAG: hypothetical protein J5643_04630 [Lachnospiraceae bacterium]|nr:hypothetical protein [Lachnospiraceae bacterium]